MDRDRRLTGYLRGQTDNVEAPWGFELNNPWRVGLHLRLSSSLLIRLDGKTLFLKCITSLKSQFTLSILKGNI